MELQKKLSKIQQTLKAPKDRTGEFVKYSYRSCEDILEAVKKLLGDVILTISDEVVLVGERYYVKSTAKVSLDKESEECIAYAREQEKKLNKYGKETMDHAQITGATSSYARKYALNGLFAIDDTKDADSMDNSNTENHASSVAPKSMLFKKMNEAVGRTILANEFGIMKEVIEDKSGMVINDIKELDQMKCKNILEAWKN